MRNRESRNTIARSVSLKGVGLHSGEATWVRVSPGIAGSGIVMRRADLPYSEPIPARWDSIGSLVLCTEISGPDGVSVSTVEHLMCALAACRIHDAFVDVGGSEIPILDGSARPFFDALSSAGLTPVSSKLRRLRVVKAVEVRVGDRFARLEPHDGREFVYEINFDNPVIGRSVFRCDLDSPSFSETVAPARTFALEAEVSAMRAVGLALGGSLANAVVVGTAGVLNPEGLRFPDEFARHKALDAIGDLSLAGSPILGRYVGYKSGHALNNALINRLMENRSSWVWSTAAADVRHLELAA